MRMKSLILIFIALGCGLVASIGISQVMERGGTTIQQLEVEQILVALADINIGDKLDAQNVRLEDWPKAKIQEGAIRSLDEVKDKFAQVRFIKGEPILAAKITDQVGNVASRIPDGYRAMPVRVEEDTVLKAISPGDRVDVMVFLRKGEGIPETGAFTILKNVRVFAVNTNTERQTEKGPEGNFRTVSLLLKPDHARELAVAREIGKILLTLRRPDQKDDLTDGEEVTPIGEILSGSAKVASEDSNNTITPAPSGLENILSNLPAVTAPLPAVPAAFKMVIYGPNETKQFEWQTREGMPVELTPTTIGPPTGSLHPAHATPTDEPATKDDLSTEPTPPATTPGE
ncbi:MAG: Flp pilus assembly protein CpaB [Pirellulaceae bacterium]|nr:Flp pilus assembly protein CpaB [Pirellulaceae bacterium]